MNFKLLKKLSEAFGVSGFEDEVRDLITDEIKEYVDEIKIDTMGNLVAVKKSKAENPLKVMVSAHIDEIGFMVRYIDDKGFLRLDSIGGIYDPYYLARQVVVKAIKKTKAIIGARTLQALNDEARKKHPETEELFIDLGLPPEEVKKLVEIGTPVSACEECIKLGDLISGKAMDDRVGVYCMIEVLKKLKSSKFEIYFVATAQEELGMRGATTSAYEIDPDIGIALDVTHAGDVPDIPPHKYVASLGEGVAIKIKDSGMLSSPELVKTMRKIADKNQIPYQLEVLPKGATDGAALQRNRGGMNAVTLSIPTRYVHSPVETCHCGDIQAAIDLLLNFLKG
jgi:putative aminopeptidase FrvX